MFFLGRSIKEVVVKIKVNIIIISLLLVFYPACYAAESQSLILSKYYQATCEDYTGTWQGMITDPTDLYGNGGPWSIQLSLSFQDGHITGRSAAIQYANSSSIPAKQIWAQCRKGVLSGLQWGKRVSSRQHNQSGLLVSKHVLVLQLRTENAMMNAEMLLFLQRKSSPHSDSFLQNKQG
jgi:hypothetical protein